MRASKKTKRTAAQRAGRGKKPKGKPAAKARAGGSTRKKRAGPRRPGSVQARSQRAAPAAANQEIELEAAVLRRLLRHFDERKDVQNIELMILAGFCRNCLSKWLVEAAQERGIELDIERAREKVYGVPYAEWKERHQQPATDEQLARFEAAERRAAERRAADKRQ